MPSWKDLEKFLQHDGWEFISRTSSADRVYHKTLSDGTRWRSRVSKGSAEIGKNLFADILKRQLYCSKSYFNKVISNKKHSTEDIDIRKK